MGYFLLVLTAFLFGSGFLVQKTAMDYIGPLFFTAIRFLIATLALSVVIVFLNYKIIISQIKKIKNFSHFLKQIKQYNQFLLYSSLAGFLLALGAITQQVGILYTNIANAGFITGLYIIIVPILYLFFGKKISIHIFIACTIAICGVYLLNINTQATQSFGDLMVLISAFLWAIHIILVDKCSKEMNNLLFATVQYFFCSIFSFILLLLFNQFLFKETIAMQPIFDVIPQIMYSGVIVVGVGYTLQVFGQKKTPAHLAALIISLEAVFASLFEVYFLKVYLDKLGILGCIFIFIAITYSLFYKKIINQLNSFLTSLKN